MRRKTFSEVKAAFENRGYELLETKYINNTTKMKFRCPKHKDLDTEITYRQLARGEGCKYCGIEKVAKSVSKRMRKYSLDYVKECFAKNGCTLLNTTYKNDKEPLFYICKCGNKSRTSFSNYKRGSGVCKRCSNKAEPKWTHETAKKYFEEQGCKLLSIYKKQGQRLKYICNCGNTSYVSLSNFIGGNRCKECADNRQRLDYEYVKSVFKENNCTLLTTEYKNSTRQKLDYICSCGNKHQIRFLAFQRGERCPQCKSISKGEKEIQKYLKKYKVDFQYQYKIDDCKNVAPLPFDFAVFKDQKLKCLIEFDGRQHFQPIDLFGGNDYFQTVKKHDKIKNDYCEENGITLHRISYKEYKNIQEKVVKIIKSG